MNFSFQINSYKRNDGTQQIRLKLSTSNKDTQYISSNINIKKNNWDSKKQIIKKHPIDYKLNADLNDLKLSVQNIYYSNTGISAKRLKDIYEASLKYDKSSFIDFYQSIIDETRLKKKIRTANTNQRYLDKLKTYSSFIAFSDLSVLWAKEYEMFLLKRGNKTNTIASNFKCISSVLNKAVKAGLLEKNPIKGYKIVTENVEKESLTLQEIERIVNLEIHSRHKGMIKARDYFLFSFYTAGMRFSDVCKLKWLNIVEEEIVYTMGKSEARSGSRRFIPLNPKSKEILEKYKNNKNAYIFPSLQGYEKATIEEIEDKLLYENNNINRAFKIVARYCEIDKAVSMHMAKHSFTDYAVKSGKELRLISKLLGHTKLSTTEHYLKDFYQEEEAKAMNDMFGEKVF